MSVQGTNSWVALLSLKGLGVRVILREDPQWHPEVSLHKCDKSEEGEGGTPPDKSPAEVIRKLHWVRTEVSHTRPPQGQNVRMPPAGKIQASRVRAADPIWTLDGCGAPFCRPYVYLRWLRKSATCPSHISPLSEAQGEPSTSWDRGW